MIRIFMCVCVCVCVLGSTRVKYKFFFDISRIYVNDMIHIIFKTMMVLKSKELNKSYDTLTRNNFTLLVLSNNASLKLDIRRGSYTTSYHNAKYNTEV